MTNVGEWGCCVRRKRLVLRELLKQAHHFERGYDRIGADPARGLRGDEIEVRSFATDDGAETDDGVVSPARGQARRGKRQLKRPRHPHRIDVFVANAVLVDRFPGAVKQPRSNGLIKAGNDKRQPDAGSV